MLANSRGRCRPAHAHEWRDKILISPAGALSFLKAIGGYNARAFTDQHRREVTGLVLIDSAHEGQWRELPIEVSEFKDAGLHQLYVGRVMARLGLLRLLNVPNPQVDRVAPAL